MDWIDGYLQYTEGTPTPDIYRLWSGITAISGALERRVWVDTARMSLYPNLFTLLVGPPATGKSVAISPVVALWKRVRKLHVAPDNVTKASLVDALFRSKRNIVVPGDLIEYSSLLVPCPELGVLIPKHDLEFLSVVNHIYDCPPHYREERRYLTIDDKNPDVPFPQLTILAGTQPMFLASMLPEEAWGMGFTSRLVMIYAGTAPKVDLFAGIEDRSALAGRLAAKLTELASDQYRGRFSFTESAVNEIRSWHSQDLAPVPTHTRLIHYNGRRILHFLKLCMVASASRGTDLTIRIEDVNRARDWLLQSEIRMPDVFREMTQKSDAQVVGELHYFMWQRWGLLPKDKRKPMPETVIYEFLRHRVPSEKIGKLLEVAEKSGIIVRLAGTTTWYPRPLNEHGAVE